MMKYLGALAVMALAPSAANAAVVTINYANVTQDMGGPVFGTLRFDTNAAVKIVDVPSNGGRGYTYESPTFTTSFNIFGTALDGTFKVDVLDFGAGGSLFYFYAPIPDLPVNMNFILQFSDGSMGGSFPDMGYENATQSIVAFVDGRTSQLLIGDVATYTVSYAMAVPEPATWAMMIGGFGMVGGAMRRRKSLSAVAAI